MSVASQNYCTVKKISIVKGKSFIPPPKIDGIMVHITPRKTPLVDIDMETLEKFCHILFNSKRKIIEKNLKSCLSPDKIEQILQHLYKELPMDKQMEKKNELLKRRAENLSVEEICQMAVGFKKL
jgi:16S rRNA (adenine1518-N6/adenine1519-N6)-dimethyltransferase